MVIFCDTYVVMELGPHGVKPYLWMKIIDMMHKTILAVSCMLAGFGDCICVCDCHGW